MIGFQSQVAGGCVSVDGVLVSERRLSAYTIPCQCSCCRKDRASVLRRHPRHDQDRTVRVEVSAVQRGWFAIA